MNTMSISYDRARLKPGDLVLVSYPMNERSNNPARKYDGQAMVVKEVRRYSQNTDKNRAMVSLYGAISDMGMPYWFLPDELIKL